MLDRVSYFGRNDRRPSFRDAVERLAEVVIGRFDTIRRQLGIAVAHGRVYFVRQQLAYLVAV